MKPKFTIIKNTKHGRLGKIETKHGNIETPAFVFCATKGALKAQWPQMAKESSTQIILSNIYHLLVYPGSKLIAKLGGLQKLTGWNGPMMSDSGGYQIFSFGYGSVSSELKGKNGVENSSKIIQTKLKITEQGARFYSYKDGSLIMLTPELAMQAQIDFGVDLAFVLDECTAFNITKEKTESSMHRSHRWEERSINYFNANKQPHQAAYGIIQGGIYEDLRIKSTQFVSNLDAFGIGIGGSLGKNINDMENVLKIVHSNNHAIEKPVHLLGIGTIETILMALSYGIDTFDCVYPTRLARHGGALIWRDKLNFVEENKRKNNSYHINLNNAEHKENKNPIDSSCNCCTCATFSRGYLHMLLKSKEILGIMALTQHNIAFMNRFMSGIRKSINEGTFETFKQAWT
jgi:queuine tRNA-ribosyltransferase